MAFNAKNLTYESQEPSFLRKLKSQYGGRDGQRHENPQARPKRMRDDDEDDDPVYINAESNEIISRQDYKELSGETQDHMIPKDKPSTSSRDETQLEPSGHEEKGSKESSSLGKDVAAIGLKKKINKAKTIGISSETHDLQTEEKDRDSGIKSIKPKKKKKVKLSFDPEE